MNRRRATPPTVISRRRTLSALPANPRRTYGHSEQTWQFEQQVAGQLEQRDWAGCNAVARSMREARVMPTFSCDFSQRPIPFEHVWEHTVGSVAPPGHQPALRRRGARHRRRVGYPQRAQLHRPRHQSCAATSVLATELVSVQLTNAPAPQAASVERIDETHANPHRAWTELGQPTYLTRSQVEHLKGVSRLIKEPIGSRYEVGTIHLDLDLPHHGVAAITMEFSAEPKGGGARLERPAP